MTTVVGIERKGKVVIGADSAGTNASGLQRTRTEPKVWEKDGILYGLSGGFGTGQAVRYYLDTPPSKGAPSAIYYLCRKLVPSIREALQKAEVPLDNEGDMDSEFILGFRGKLYSLSCDFQISRHDIPYVTTGSGGHYALGALHTILNGDDGDKTPPSIVKRALLTAEYFDSSTRGPFSFITNSEMELT